MRRRWLAVAWLNVILIAGCATTVPYTGVGPHPQVERGAPIPPVDFLGNVLALPGKLLLWNWKFANHYVSPDTEHQLVTYLNTQDTRLMQDAKFTLNAYHPGQDLARLVKNRHVAWPYRVLLGFPLTLVFDVLLPGRVFPWGDHYNPYTNTVHLYSDHPAVALHEAGHVHDFAKRHHKGTYAAARLIPFVDLYQEYQATDEAIDYLIRSQNHETELRAYKILYPAYGTYMGGYLFPPFGLVFVIGGHLHGRETAREQAELYRHMKAPPIPTTPLPPPSPTPVSVIPQ